MAAEPPEGVRPWSGPPRTATRVVGRRVVQGVIDIVVSWTAPLPSLALFVFVPVGADRVNVVGLAVVSAVVIAVVIGVQIWYWVVRPARQRGQTWGMQLMGIRVVQHNGLPAGPRALLLRRLLLAVDGLGLGLVGLAVMLASPRRQRLGDRVAGTVVVRDLG